MGALAAAAGAGSWEECLEYYWTQEGGLRASAQPVWAGLRQNTERAGGGPSCRQPAAPPP